jgi:hypothetical protein
LIFISFDLFSLFPAHAPGALSPILRGMVTLFFQDCVIICFVFISFSFILVYFYNTHQVLLGPTQGVGGLAFFILRVQQYKIL